MKSEPVTNEVVLKEYSKTSYWLDGRRIRAVGNLILTNERLIFLRQVVLSKEDVETIKKVAQDTSKLLQFGLSLHKKNLQLPLSAIVGVRMGLVSFFPVRPCLRVDYITGSKNIKTLSFMFVPPFFKRLMMSEFPTLSWISAIKKAVKAKQKAAKK